MTGHPQLAMQVFRAEVVGAHQLAPSLRRVVLGGPGLAGFASTGVGDEYLRVVFPAPGRTEPQLPDVRDGVLDYRSVDLDLMRTYTVRSHDAARGEVTVDVVLHHGGVASTWARTARPGNVVGLTTPTAMHDPPPGLEWQVLVADTAALPALARILEQTPPDVRTRVVVEVPDARHRLPLLAPPRAEVTWVHGGNGCGPSHLQEALASLPRPRGVGYTWVAGETRVLRGVRRYLRRDLGLPASAYKAVGYWTQHAERWRSAYAALDPVTRRGLESLWDSGRAEQDVEAEYDDRLEELGL